MRSKIVSVIIVASQFALTDLPARGGNLTPPVGPVSPTMKTLLEVEPRINVNSLPGSGTAVHVINLPGSYYLTGDVIGVAGKHGIEILNLGVSLDLNGFVVRGIAGSADGISIVSDATVHNGAVIGFGGSGVNVCNNAILRNLRLSLNQVGATVCRGSVSECVAQQNATGFVGFGALFNRCTATSNSAEGFSISNGSSAVECIAPDNLHGISAGGGALVANCTANGNSANGIVLAGSSTATGCVSYVNQGSGILAYGNANTIDTNRVSNNAVGVSVSGTRTLVVRNVARGNGTGFSIAPNNDDAEILTNPGAGFIATNPWANFADNCPSGQTLCSGICVNTLADSNNCGNCGVVCPQGFACINGACVMVGCQSASDCPPRPNASAQCVAFNCQYSCNAGFADCNGNMMADGCETFIIGNDPNNCGGCGLTCPSGFMCVNGFCQPVIDCTNGNQDGGETDVDCGGPNCPPCGDFLGCLSASDCISGVCASGFCQPPSCFDGVQNGMETGIDCGGDCLICP